MSKHKKNYLFPFAALIWFSGVSKRNICFLVSRECFDRLSICSSIRALGKTFYGKVSQTWNNFFTRFQIKIQKQPTRGVLVKRCS